MENDYFSWMRRYAATCCSSLAAALRKCHRSRCRRDNNHNKNRKGANTESAYLATLFEVGALHRGLAVPDRSKPSSHVVVPPSLIWQHFFD